MAAGELRNSLIVEGRRRGALCRCMQRTSVFPTGKKTLKLEFFGLFSCLLFHVPWGCAQSVPFLHHPFTHRQAFHSPSKEWISLLSQTMFFLSSSIIFLFPSSSKTRTAIFLLRIILSRPSTVPPPPKWLARGTKILGFLRSLTTSTSPTFSRSWNL